MTDQTPQKRRREIDPVLDRVRSVQIEQGENIAILGERVENLLIDEKETHDRLDTQIVNIDNKVSEVSDKLTALSTQIASIPLGQHIQEHAFLKVLIDQAEAETKKKQAVSLFMTQEKIKLAKSTILGALVICAGVGWFLIKYWFTNETGIEVPD